jgi:hypothetical protein
MAAIISVAWPERRIKRLSMKIHPLGDVIPPSLRRAVCSNNYYIGEYKRQYKCIFAYDSY